MKFSSYKAFLKWVYDPSTKTEQGTWPRLKEKMKIEIDGDHCYYTSVMDCLHAHEEG